MRLEENTKTFFLKEEHITKLLSLNSENLYLDDECFTAMKVILSSTSFAPGLYEQVGDKWSKVENMY